MRASKEEKVKIRAVHDDDLRSFLQRIGLLEDIQNDKIKCFCCDCSISLENFGGLFKENGELKVFCQKPECYLEVLSRKNKNK